MWLSRVAVVEQGAAWLKQARRMGESLAEASQMEKKLVCIVFCQLETNKQTHKPNPLRF